MATNTEIAGKLQILDFCAKNKLPLPEFERQPQTTVYYTVLVWVEVPIIGSDAPRRFEEKVTAGKKREAENQASLVILKRLKSWLAEYNPPDLSNVRQKLTVLIQRNKYRFALASFDSGPVESGSCFQCRVEVSDTIVGTNYTAVGQGKGKKDAEKDGAYRMLCILERLFATPDNSTKHSPSATEEQSQSIQSKLSLKINSPSASLTKLTAVTKNFVNYRSKLHEYCQQNGLTPSYVEVDNDHNPKKFSTQLTIKGNAIPTRGCGSSKKEASEEAARLMWSSLYLEVPQSQSESNDSNKDQFNPNMALSVLEPNNLSMPPFLPEDENTVEVEVETDYTQTLNNKFATKVVKFVAIPFESDEHFYFASVAEIGKVPFLAGHGRGSSVKGAKNEAAKNCLELYVDFKDN